MKKIIIIVALIFSAVCAYSAAVTNLTPGAIPTATIIPTLIPEPSPTVHVSAIELYRQMTGNKKERVFEPTSIVIKQSSQETVILPAGWFLIAADAALLGWSFFAIVDQNNAVDSYERLKTQLNVPPYNNYDFLIREQEKANSKSAITTIALSLTGICAVYTTVDLFILHSAFPLKLVSAYNPNKCEFKALFSSVF